MIRYEDLPPHLRRPYERPPLLQEELPLEELPPPPEMGSRGEQVEEPPPPDPFLRRT
jgi:hypothetical protein